MARREVEDTVRIPVQVSREVVERRWWRVVQPPPSVSFSLRGRIGAAFGPLVDVAMREFSRVTDPDAEEALAADVATLGETAALRAFRRARSGEAIADGGRPADEVATTLLAVATYVARATGGRIDGPLLLGTHERCTADDPDALGFRWPGPSLLHRLLLDSHLTYGGSGEKFRAPSGRAGEEHPGARLFDAVNRGSVGGFVGALDDLVTGPDELTLLVAWALLHLWRPF